MSLYSELPQKDPFNIRQLLVEGCYTPNAVELLEKLDGLILAEELKATKLIDKENFTLSFDSRDHAHLFALYLGAEGHRKGIFQFSLSDTFFQTDLLDDFRPDGVVLSLSESIREGKNELSVILRQGSEDYRDKLTNLVKETVSTSIPHLSTEVNDLTFNS